MKKRVAQSKKRQSAKSLTAKLPRFSQERGPLPIKSLLVAYTILLVISALLATVAALYTDRGQTAETASASPFTSRQFSSVGFTLYYPEKLPQGLHIDQPDTSLADTHIVTIRVTDGLGSATGRSFSISQQRLPATYNLGTFANSLEDKTIVETTYGQAVIGSADAGQTKLAGLATNDGTLLLIQAGNGVKPEDLVQTLESLKAAPR